MIKSEIIKNDIEFKTSNNKVKAKNQRYRNMKILNTKREKPRFPKKKKRVENTDLYKTLMRKITVTPKECIKYNFGAPLNVIFDALLSIITYSPGSDFLTPLLG